ncbi:MAG: hypothetical protein MI920_20695 [Kiloniellales bacterium]|nr:hypothetical protein [Kiloniellales bacterium]
MEAITGTSLPVFIGLTLGIMGFAAFMTGQALANTWRPVWQAVIYSFLLGFADRFLTWGLFEGELLSLRGYFVDSLVLLAISLTAYRITQARKMVTQYPWLYERSGLFGWREKGGI